MNRMPLKYFDRTSHGDVLPHHERSDTVAQSLNQSISKQTAIYHLRRVLIMMLSISITMTIVAASAAGNPC